MKKIIVLICAAAVIGGGIAAAVLLTKPKNTAAAIKSGIDNKYYICDILPDYFYHYRNPDIPMDLELSDRSFCYFDDNFKTFIVFFIGPNSAQFDFIVTKISRNKKNLSANVINIMNGKIYNYQLRTDKEKIVLTANVTYTVEIETENSNGTYEQTVTRVLEVLIFYRKKPTHIGVNP